MSFQKKFAIVIGLFALLVVGWISLEFESGEVPFISVGDLIDNHSRYTQSRFRMGGNVDEGSISFSEDKLTVSFVLRQGDDRLPVTYTSAEIPDLFKDEAEVIVEGKYREGVFQADNLMTKCASRYEEEANYKPITEG